MVEGVTVNLLSAPIETVIGTVTLLFALSVIIALHENDTLPCPNATTTNVPLPPESCFGLTWMPLPDAGQPLTDAVIVPLKPLATSEMVCVSLVIVVALGFTPGETTMVIALDFSPTDCTSITW